MEPYTAQDVRSSGQPQPPVTTMQNPRISETNFVEDMTFSSSALDGVTVANAEFTEVSMIEEIFAVEKRKAIQSGPDSDGSDRRTAKKVAQDNTEQTQFAVRGSAEARVSASGGGPSASRESGGPSANRVSASGGGPSASRESASVGGPSMSILERPRAVAYSKTPGQPVEQSSSQTEGGEAGKEAMEAQVQRSKEEEKEMEMLVARREVEKTSSGKVEKTSSGKVEKKVVGEGRVEGGEKRMEVMVVGEGVEGEKAADGQRKVGEGVEGEKAVDGRKKGVGSQGSGRNDEES
jgi:hypothetical protein